MLLIGLLDRTTQNLQLHLHRKGFLKHKRDSFSLGIIRNKNTVQQAHKHKFKQDSHALPLWKVLLIVAAILFAALLFQIVDQLIAVGHPIAVHLHQATAVDQLTAAVVIVAVAIAGLALSNRPVWKLIPVHTFFSNASLLFQIQ